MTGQCQGQVFPGNAHAVIPHPHALYAPLLRIHVHLARAGVQAVFHQLLDDGSRALHHLAGGDLVYELGRQGVDAAGHGRIVPQAPRHQTKKAPPCGALKCPGTEAPGSYQIVNQIRQR